MTQRIMNIHNIAIYYIYIRNVFRKKRYYVGIFPTWADPPPPPQYGNAHVKNIVFFLKKLKKKHVLAPQNDFA